MGDSSRETDRKIHSDTGPFAIIPEWVLDLPISDRAVRLYAILSRYADADGYSWPSRKTLAERLFRSVDALDRAVKELMEYGVLEVIARFDDAGDRTSNGYSIKRVMPAALREGSRETAATGSRDAAATGSRETAALTRATMNESQLNESGTSRSIERRDVEWEMMLEVCGIDASDIPASARGAYNRAVKDLRSVGATPEEIVRRAWVFRQRWPEASLTPTALARRWAECDPERQHKEKPRTEGQQRELSNLTEAWEGK
jgi:hypothetical protein